MMANYITAVKYDLPITVVIVKNNTLGQIKWEQIVFLGNPEYVCDLQEIDFAKFAEACGGVGFSVTEPNDIHPTLKEALSCVACEGEASVRDASLHDAADAFKDRTMAGGPFCQSAFARSTQWKEDRNNSF